MIQTPAWDGCSNQMPQNQHAGITGDDYRPPSPSQESHGAYPGLLDNSSTRYPGFPSSPTILPWPQWLWVDSAGAYHPMPNTNHYGFVPQNQSQLAYYAAHPNVAGIHALSMLQGQDYRPIPPWPYVPSQDQLIPATQQSWVDFRGYQDFMPMTGGAAETLYYLHAAPSQHMYETYQHLGLPADQTFQTPTTNELQGYGQTGGSEDASSSLEEEEAHSPNRQSPVQCAMCGKTVKTRKSLRRHWRDVHHGLPPGTPERGYYMCVCGKHSASDRKREFLEHLGKPSTSLPGHGRHALFCRCLARYSVGDLGDFISHVKSCRVDHPRGRPSLRGTHARRTRSAPLPSV